MGVILRGRIEDGRVILSDRVALPDGTIVTVAIDVAPSHADEASPQSPVDFATEPYFGLWADRQDLADSVEWVNRQRDAWRQRAIPEG